MAQPFLGEIRMFAGNFPPNGWMFCNGATLPISENETLFNLIGTTYGGDGQETFVLPNLQSRIPINVGTGSDGITYQIGQMVGAESVTLSEQQIPSHTHTVVASTNGGNVLSPQNAVLAAPSSSQAGIMAYVPPPIVNLTMLPTEITSVGGSQPHDNLQPYLCINYIISLFGVFPAPS